MDTSDMKKLWNETKKFERATPLTLSDRISFLYRTSLKSFEIKLARYKFAAKMMRGEGLSLLDLGCNEGTGLFLLSQECNFVDAVGIDFDGEAIEWAREHLGNEKLSFLQCDFIEDRITISPRDYVVSMDVIEHIPQKYETKFFEVITANLKSDGVAIIGTPNEMMVPYACEASRAGHVNNYNQERLYETAKAFFNNVFIFGMNDEVLNTGFDPMSCYIFALCCCKK